MPQQLVLENTPSAFIIALILVGLLAWRVKPFTFRSLRWQSMGIASALFWSVLATVLISFAWDLYYSLFVPPWYRLAAPLGAILLYSVLGLGMRWVALKLPGHPVITFCLLGGLESIPEHAVGIYRFNILQIPLLQGDSPLAIFIFAYFEYVIFWGIVLLLALGLERLFVKLKARHKESDPG
jgi:hypothetical protein